MAKSIKNGGWDNGLPAVEVPEEGAANPVTSKPTRKARRRNKRVTAKAYRMAYKALRKPLPAELKAKLVDPNNYDREVQDFCKSVIVLAEGEDK